MALHPLRYVRHVIVALLLVALTATSSSAQYCGYACVKVFGFIQFELDGTWVFSSCFSLPEMDGSTTIYCIYTRSSL